ncbi:MAG: hypoxanthine phosphoribosyltransferase [Planctomycetota bacterium]
MPTFDVLLGRDRILRRVAELAGAIRARHRDPSRLCIVAVMEGARVFCRHLVPQLGTALRVHEIRAKSYLGTSSSGTVSLSGADALDVRGKEVLLVEDIVDTGRTIARLREHMASAGAASVEVVTLLSKPSRREVQVQVEWIGFEIEDHFVIGFGLDFDGLYRELPEVVIYDPARA